MRIEVERSVDTTFQRLIHHEIQAVKVIKFEPLDVALEEVGESRLQAIGGDLRFDRRIVAGIQREEAHIGAVAFVAGSCMGD